MTARRARTRPSSAGGRRPGPRPSRRSAGAPGGLRHDLRDPGRGRLHPGRHRRTWTRTGTSGCRASTRSPGASRPRCTAPASGRCASTPASRRPPRPTSASATSSSRARPGCRSPSTCRPRWATTRTPPRPRGRSAGSASRSRRWPTWRPCSPGSRSAT